MIEMRRSTLPLFLSMVFRMVMSLRMQATRASFFGFSGGKQTLVEQLYGRIKLRSHQSCHVQRCSHSGSATKRGPFPCIFPESLFRGATPVRALISRRLSFPCSGSSAISDATVISPTPFTLPISLACSLGRMLSCVVSFAH